MSKSLSDAEGAVKEAEMDLVRTKWNERRLMREVREVTADKTKAEAGSVEKAKRIDTLESALQTHIEARSLIITTVRDCIEKFVNEVMGTNENGHSIDWVGGKFTG